MTSKLYEKALKATAECERWNARYPVGCTVLMVELLGEPVSSSVRRIQTHQRVRTCTTSPAIVSSYSGEAVIKLEGIDGFFPLCRVEPDGNDVPLRAIELANQWSRRAADLRKIAGPASRLSRRRDPKKLAEARILSRCARELRRLITPSGR